ncbi:MRG-domain-containing protein [Flagelloscypha sp. PMI_526]|nr:MRG-domain-containing protein [Flagelloscypha sp. PMI_526]
MSVSNSPATPTFRVDERVLAYHGPLIYEAKVLEVRNVVEGDEELSGALGYHYKVHYKGWKSSWDEYVHFSRLLKFTEENLAEQKRLRQNQQAVAQPKGGKYAKDKKPTTSSTGGNLPRGVKRSRDDDPSSLQSSMVLDCPELLKAVLVDDWENITKNNMVVTIPRSPCASEILSHYEQYLKDEKPDGLYEPENLATTVVAGLKIYFDKSLGAKLLYRFERPQYESVRHKYMLGQHLPPAVFPDKPMSEVYGGEHLLRMLVILPEMISASQLDSESVFLLQNYVNELLRYLARNKEQYFLSAYENTAPQYQHQINKT